MQKCPRKCAWHASCFRATRTRRQTNTVAHRRDRAATTGTETAIMNTRRLGNSDLRVTPIGFGAWAIGGSGWEFAWGSQDDSDSIAAIHEALDAGVNWIDTAAVYGLGHSEQVVARALTGMSNP